MQVSHGRSARSTRYHTQRPHIAVFALRSRTPDQHLTSAGARGFAGTGVSAHNPIAGLSAIARRCAEVVGTPVQMQTSRNCTLRTAGEPEAARGPARPLPDGWGASMPCPAPASDHVYSATTVRSILPLGVQQGNSHTSVSSARRRLHEESPTCTPCKRLPAPHSCLLCAEVTAALCVALCGR